MSNVTVCVPTFNSAKTVGLCLDSVLSQTVKPKEVLVCDGGSTDATLDIARAFDAKIVGVKVKGVGEARAKLLEHVQTPLIAWIDADATIPRNWLKQHVKAHKTLDADCVSGPASLVNLAGAILGSDSTLPNSELTESKKISWTALTMRKQSILDAGGFDPVFEYDGDFDLSLRLRKNGAKLYWCDKWVSYHVATNAKSLRKSLLAGNYVLYLQKYGFKYVLWNPKHFVSFLLRIWLLYSLFATVFSFWGLVSAVFAVSANFLAHTIYTRRMRGTYLAEQFLKAVGEHRNLYRLLKNRIFANSQNWRWM